MLRRPKAGSQVCDVYEMEGPKPSLHPTADGRLVINKEFCGLRFTFSCSLGSDETSWSPIEVTDGKVTRSFRWSPEKGLKKAIHDAWAKFYLRPARDERAA